MSSATRVLVRLAADLVVRGLAHPVAAALARGSRMHTLAAPVPFAAMLGIDEFTLRRAEAGAMAFDELPAAYLSHLDAIEPAIDLVGLRCLAQRIDGSVGPRRGAGPGRSAAPADLALRRASRSAADLSYAG